MTTHNNGSAKHKDTLTNTPTGELKSIGQQVEQGSCIFSCDLGMRLIGVRNFRQMFIKNRNSTVSSTSTVRHTMTFNKFHTT
jgi:hypothetical protein